MAKKSFKQDRRPEGSVRGARVLTVFVSQNAEGDGQAGGAASKEPHERFDDDDGEDFVIGARRGSPEGVSTPESGAEGNTEDPGFPPLGGLMRGLRNCEVSWQSLLS